MQSCYKAGLNSNIQGVWNVWDHTENLEFHLNKGTQQTCLRFWTFRNWNILKASWVTSVLVHGILSFSNSFYLNMFFLLKMQNRSLFTSGFRHLHLTVLHFIQNFNVLAIPKADFSFSLYFNRDSYIYVMPYFHTRNTIDWLDSQTHYPLNWNWLPVIDGVTAGKTTHGNAIHSW